MWNLFESVDLPIIKQVTLTLTLTLSLALALTLALILTLPLTLALTLTLTLTLPLALTLALPLALLGAGVRDRALRAAAHLPPRDARCPTLPNPKPNPT